MFMIGQQVRIRREYSMMFADKVGEIKAIDKNSLLYLRISFGGATSTFGFSAEEVEAVDYNSYI